MLVRERTGSIGVGASLAATVVVLVVATIVQRAAGADSLTSMGAIALGLVEGITEFLPVSSTGHLLVAGRALGLGGTEAQDQALDTYAICIQLGAIVAVITLYRERLVQMAYGLMGRSAEGRRVALGLVGAAVPTVIIALSLQGLVREHLYGPAPTAAAWLVGGVLILAWPVARAARPGAVELGSLTMRHAVLIGVAQAVALWPGTSRSLVTIVAALAVGLSMAAAVEFSFLLGLVTLAGATVFEGAQNGQQLVDSFGWFTPTLGLVVAFASAVVAVRWMVGYLQERGLELFGWYRIAIGLITFGAIGAGLL